MEGGSEAVLRAGERLAGAQGVDRAVLLEACREYVDAREGKYDKAHYSPCSPRSPPSKSASSDSPLLLLPGRDRTSPQSLLFTIPITTLYQTWAAKDKHRPHAYSVDAFLDDRDTATLNGQTLTDYYHGLVYAQKFQLKDHIPQLKFDISQHGLTSASTARQKKTCPAKSPCRDNWASSTA
jgi:hypothetical protein